MKMRKMKRVKMAWLSEWVYWQRQIDKAMEFTPQEKAASDAFYKALWEDLLGKPITTVVTPRTWSVRRVKDGELVGTFDDLGDAEEAVLKAHRQKKAKLEIVNL